MWAVFHSVRRRVSGLCRLRRASRRMIVERSLHHAGCSSRLNFDDLRPVVIRAFGGKFSLCYSRDKLIFHWLIRLKEFFTNRAATQDRVVAISVEHLTILAEP